MNKTSLFNESTNNQDVKDFVDTLFKLFCSYGNNLLELYNYILLESDNKNHLNLLEGNNIVEHFYIDKSLRSIYTLYNDVSFLTKNNKNIVLLESQSVRSRYMTLRMILYYSDLIKKYMQRNNLNVHETALKDFSIPEPMFYVLHMHNTNSNEYNLEYLFKMNLSESENKNRIEPNKFLQCKVKNITISQNKINNIYNNNSNNIEFKNLEIYTEFFLSFKSKLNGLIKNNNTEEEISIKRVKNS